MSTKISKIIPNNIRRVASVATGTLGGVFAWAYVKQKTDSDEAALMAGIMAGSAISVIADEVINSNQ